MVQDWSSELETPLHSIVNMPLMIHCQSHQILSSVYVTQTRVHYVCHHFARTHFGPFWFHSCFPVSDHASNHVSAAHHVSHYAESVIFEKDEIGHHPAYQSPQNCIIYIYMCASLGLYRPSNPACLHGKHIIVKVIQGLMLTLSLSFSSLECNLYENRKKIMFETHNAMYFPGEFLE